MMINIRQNENLLWNENWSLPVIKKGFNSSHKITSTLVTKIFYKNIFIVLFFLYKMPVCSRNCLILFYNVVTLEKLFNIFIIWYNLICLDWFVAICCLYNWFALEIWWNVYFSILKHCLNSSCRKHFFVVENIWDILYYKISYIDYLFFGTSSTSPVMSTGLQYWESRVPRKHGTLIHHSSASLLTCTHKCNIVC